MHPATRVAPGGARRQTGTVSPSAVNRTRRARPAPWVVVVEGDPFEEAVDEAAEVPTPLAAFGDHRRGRGAGGHVRRRDGLEGPFLRGLDQGVTLVVPALGDRVASLRAAERL